MYLDKLDLLSKKDYGLFKIYFENLICIKISFLIFCLLLSLIGICLPISILSFTLIFGSGFIGNLAISKMELKLINSWVNNKYTNKTSLNENLMIAFLYMYIKDNDLDSASNLEKMAVYFEKKSLDSKYTGISPVILGGFSFLCGFGIQFYLQQLSLISDPDEAFRNAQNMASIIYHTSLTLFMVYGPWTTIMNIKYYRYKELAELLRKLSLWLDHPEGLDALLETAKLVKEGNSKAFRKPWEKRIMNLLRL